MYRFNTSSGTNRHKYWRLDVAMVGMNDPNTSLSAGGLQIKCQSFNHFLEDDFLNLCTGF